MGIFQTWKTMKAAVYEAKNDARAACDNTVRHGYAINNIEKVLHSAGLADFNLYRVPGESDVDVAELEAMVHMLADHLGLEWVTVPETSSWEKPVETQMVVGHAIGVLVATSKFLNSAGVLHPAIDAALVELGKIQECACST